MKKRKKNKNKKQTKKRLNSSVSENEDMLTLHLNAHYTARNSGNIVS